VQCDRFRIGNRLRDELCPSKRLVYPSGNGSYGLVAAAGMKSMRDTCCGAFANS
jgi:hypothetical protein